MKIAFFTDTYYPQLNGVTISVFNFARELRKKGHTVYIFAPQIKNYKDREKDVYRLPSIKILSSEPEVMFPVGVTYKSLAKFVRINFDIIHAHGNGAFSLLGYEVAHAEGIPFILTFHTLHTEYTHYFLKGRVVKPHMVAHALRFLANRCDGVITPSEKMKQKLIEFGYKKSIKVIPNFVDVSQFANKDSGYLHKKLKLPQDTPLILTVGRLGKEKNFGFLIEMFAQIVKKNDTAHLVIVGQGPEKAFLLQLAKELGLTDRVHLTGRIASKYMPEVYKDASLFVFASTTETQGLCVLEAAASGLPLVVVDDLAFSAVVKNGENGYRVGLNASRFAGKVQEVLSDKKLVQQFGKKSQQRVREDFQADDLTDKLLHYYQQTEKSYRPRPKILRHVNNVAVRGVRGIRRTKRITTSIFYRLVPSR